jgi:hypothetical protein
VIRTVARFAAVTATSVTMLALLPAAASANVTFHAGSIQYANKAQLQGDGTIMMTFTYECVPGFEGFPGAESGRLEVSVQQPEVDGFAVSPATCNDRKHTVTLDIAPGPFKEGSAFAEARLDNSMNFVAEKEAEIQIK